MPTALIAPYFDALVRTFEQALKTIVALPENRRPKMLARLDVVRRVSHNFDYGVGDDMDALLAEAGFDDPPG
jgi:phage-related protein